MAKEKRKGPFKTMDPLTWVPDQEKTEWILRGMPDEKDRKGKERG